MSFHKDRNGYLVSSDGYAVRRSGRNELEYVSEGVKAIVPVEAGYDPGHFLTIYAFAIERTGPEGKTGPLSDDDRQMFVEHVCACLDFETTRYKVEWHPS